MKKYTFGFLIVAIVSILGATLFTNSFEPIDNLMSPPKLFGDNYSIQFAFEETVGENYVLRYPTKGDYRSAFTFIDLTGDKDEEVIVFYSRAEEIGVVRMNVLDEIDGTWVSIADFESVHSEIQQIEFADLNNDDKIEIITGWATYANDISKKLNIYEIEIGPNNSVSIKNVFEDDYSEFYVYDVDNNSVSDILNLKYRANGPATEYVASFLKFGQNGVYEQGFIPLDKSISSVKSSSSELYGDLRRIYIDGYKIDSGMATDGFYWDDTSKTFERLMVDRQNLTAITSRNTNVFSRDIDKDSDIEIPIEEMLPASSVISLDRASSSEQALIKWVHIENGDIKKEKYQIINQSGGYDFDFDDDWIGKVTVKHYLADDVLTFYELSFENRAFVSGKPLFSIKTVDISHDEKADNLTYYKYLGENNGKYYYYRIYSGGESFGVDRKSIVKRINFT